MPTPAAAPHRIEHANQHNLYWTTGEVNPGPSPMSLVAFPSAKAHMFDTADRHFAARPIFFGYADARGAILFFDGSVRPERSGDAVTPWWPRQPKLPTGQVYTYAPATWEPPTLNGQPTEVLEDEYRWTREGLLGRDF